MLPLNNYQIVANASFLHFNADWIGGLMKVINTLNGPITWKQVVWINPFLAIFIYMIN